MRAERIAWRRRRSWARSWRARDAAGSFKRVGTPMASQAASNSRAWSEVSPPSSPQATKASNHASSVGTSSAAWKTPPGTCVARAASRIAASVFKRGDSQTGRRALGIQATLRIFPGASCAGVCSKLELISSPCWEASRPASSASPSTRRPTVADTTLASTKVATKL